MGYKYAYSVQTLDRVQKSVGEMASCLMTEIPDPLCPDDDERFAHMSDDLMVTLERASMQAWESWLDQQKAGKPAV